MSSLEENPPYKPANPVDNHLKKQDNANTKSTTKSTTKSNEDKSLYSDPDPGKQPFENDLGVELHQGGKKRRKSVRRRKSVKRKSNSGKRKHKIGRKTKRRK